MTSPEAYQMTTEKLTDIVPELPNKNAIEKSTNNSPKPKEVGLPTKLQMNRIMCQLWIDFDYNSES
jgi:hypothetical protein